MAYNQNLITSYDTTKNQVFMQIDNVIESAPSLEGNYVKTANIFEKNDKLEYHIQNTFQPTDNNSITGFMINKDWTPSQNATIDKSALSLDITYDFQEIPIYNRGVVLPDELPKIIYTPSFLTLQNGVYKCVNPFTYKVVDVTEVALNGALENTALGSDTHKVQLIILIDNKDNKYSQAGSWQQLAQSLCYGGKVNVKSDPISSNGYRAQPNQVITHNGATYQNKVTKLELCFGAGIASASENYVHVSSATNQVITGYQASESTPPSTIQKYYRIDYIPFGMLTNQYNSEGDSELSNGLNMKGMFILLQTGDTKDDIKDFIDARMVKSSKDFTPDGMIIDLLDSNIGRAIVSEHDLQQLSKDQNNYIAGVQNLTGNGALEKFNELPLIFRVGIHQEIAMAYDVTLPSLKSFVNQNNEMAIASAVIRYEDLTELQQPARNGSQGSGFQLIASRDKVFADNVPYVKLADLNAEFITNADPVVYGFTLDECIQALQAVASQKSLIITDEEYNQIKATLQLKDNPTAQYYKAFGGLVDYYSSDFLRLVGTGNLDVADANQAEDATKYDINTLAQDCGIWLKANIWDKANNNTGFQIIYMTRVTTALTQDDITLRGVTRKQHLKEFAYFVSNFSENSSNILRPSLVEETIRNYNMPKDNDLQIGHLVLNKDPLTQAQISQDFEFAKVRRDYDGFEPLTSKLVPDLHVIKDYEGLVTKKSNIQINSSNSQFLNDLMFGRVRKKMGVGSRFFINLYPAGWQSSDGYTPELFYEYKIFINDDLEQANITQEQIDTILEIETMQNPDLDCEQVWFKIRDDIIPYDYWTAKKSNIKAQIILKAKTKNNTGEHIINFEIAKPVIAGLLIQKIHQNNITLKINDNDEIWSNRVDSAGVYWYKRYLNLDYEEMLELGLFDAYEKYYRTNKRVLTTPDRFCYKDNDRILVEADQLGWYANVANKLQDVEAYTKDNKIITITRPINPYTHAGAVQPINTNNTPAGATVRERAWHYIDLDTYNNVHTQGDFFISCVAPKPETSHIYYRTEFMISPDSNREICFYGVAGVSRNNKICYHTGQGKFYFYGTSGTKIYSHNLKTNQWYILEFIAILDLGNSNQFTYRVRYQAKDLKTFKESDYYDDTKWRDISDTQGGWIYENHKFAKTELLRTDAQNYNEYGIRIYNDAFPDCMNLTRTICVGAIPNKQNSNLLFWNSTNGAFDNFIEKVQQFMQNPDDPTTDLMLQHSGEFEPFKNYNRTAFTKSEFLIPPKKDGTKPAYNKMISAFSMHSNLLLEGISFDQEQQNRNCFQVFYQNKVEGFQKSITSAIFNRSTKRWELGKSPYTQFLDKEAGLPFCSDYRRMVRMKHINSYKDVNEIIDSFMLKDSTNYEPIVSSSTKFLEHIAPNGKVWSSRKDYMYDTWAYEPAFHKCIFDSICVNVALNQVKRMRFEFVSMGAFEINPQEIVEQLFGEGWVVNENATTYFDASRFFGKDREGKDFHVGSAEIISNTRVKSMLSRSNFMYASESNEKPAKLDHSKGHQLDGFWLSSFPATVHHAGLTNPTELQDKTISWGTYPTIKRGNEVIKPELELQVCGGAPHGLYGGKAAYGGTWSGVANRTHHRIGEFNHAINNRFKKINNVSQSLLNYIFIESTPMGEDYYSLINIEYINDVNRGTFCKRWSLWEEPIYVGEERAGCITYNYTPVPNTPTWTVYGGYMRNESNSYHSTCVGVGSGEYAVQYSINKDHQNFLSHFHGYYPLIDYSYYDYTKDNLTSAGQTCSDYTGTMSRKVYRTLGGSSEVSTYRGVETHANKGGRIMSTERLYNYQGISYWYVPYGYRQWYGNYTDENFIRFHTIARHTMGAINVSLHAGSYLSQGTYSDNKPSDIYCQFREETGAWFLFYNEDSQEDVIASGSVNAHYSYREPIANPSVINYDSLFGSISNIKYYHSMHLVMPTQSITPQLTGLGKVKKINPQASYLAKDKNG